jgi:tetratricopeptide (TPR) repeat protein
MAQAKKARQPLSPARKKQKDPAARTTAKQRGQGQTIKNLVRPRAAAHELDGKNFEAQLTQLKRAYKRGELDGKTKATARAMVKYLHRIGLKELPQYWKARTLLYELNELLDFDETIVNWTFKDGTRVYEELQGRAARFSVSPPRTYQERRLLKEKVLFCACFGHALKRRAAGLEASLATFKWLLDFTTKLATVAMPSYGTKANLSYHLGSVYRLQERLGDSENMYRKALDFYYERAKSRPDGDLDDQVFTTRRIAMCTGFGFGWLSLTRGRLRRAESYLATAHAMLAKSLDPVVPAYIKLLYGTIKRCRAGHDKAKLQEAIESLIEAHDELKQSRRHKIRACWELALAYTETGDCDKASAYLQLVDDFHARRDDYRWQSNVSRQRSRIQRKRRNYQQALQDAEEAVAQALQSRQPLPMIDALITRGEARLYLANNAAQAEALYKSARLDFEQALQMLASQRPSDAAQEETLNPKIAAVCELRLALWCARTGNVVEALSHVERSKELLLDVEHQWVRDLAQKVRAEIEESKGFFIISPNEPESWNYSKQLTRLQTWLAHQAYKKAGTWEKAGELIDVGTSTAHAWSLDVSPTSKRARTTRHKGKQDKEQD